MSNSKSNLIKENFRAKQILQGKKKGKGKEDKVEKREEEKREEEQEKEEEQAGAELCQAQHSLS